MPDDILLDIDGQGIGVLTVNRPHVRNALNWAAMQAFAGAVERARQAPGLRALIVTGAGRSFVAGGDLSELQAYPARADGLRLALIMGEALAALSALPGPTIAAVNGPARGGGAEVAMACDLRVMADDADIGFVHATLGLIPGWGGGQRLLRVAGYAAALDLLATGRVLSAAEAHGLGLVNRVVPAGQALTAARQLAAQIASNPPEATQAAKRILRLGLSSAETAALQAERAEFPPLWDSDFRREAMRRFVQRSGR